MLHGCFVVVPTSFMCTFIHFLAFSGTNLLTRCRSASSCFLLFLRFRKIVHKIFSELHGTKTQGLVSPYRSRIQKESRRGATGWPNTPDAASPRPAPGVCLGPPGLRRL